MTITRKFTAVLVTVAAAAVPAVASAQPNTGSGPAGDSDYCKTLKDRAQYYNDLARDAGQPKKVRDFYASRANLVLFYARQAGCQWSGQAAQVSPTAQVDATTATTATAKTRSKYRSAKRTRTTTATTTTRTNTARIKANPSGNGNLDNYCNQVAALIADAEAQADQALINGDQQGAAEWAALADYMTYESTKNGCRFTLGLKASQAQVNTAGTATRG